MDKAPTNKDEEKAKAVTELNELRAANEQDAKIQAAMIDELEKSGAISKERADELRKIGGIKIGEGSKDDKKNLDDKKGQDASKPKYSEAEKATQFVALSGTITDEKKKIVQAINKTGTAQFGKLAKLKKVSYRLEEIEDLINSDKGNSIPKIGLDVIENLPNDIDKTGLYHINELIGKYEELLLSKNEEPELTTENADSEKTKDGKEDEVVDLEKVEAEIRAIKKDADFIRIKKEALVAKGCPKMEAQAMATCEEAINRAQAKTNILIKNPEAKDAEARLKELEKVITENTNKLAELRLKNNIAEEEQSPDKILSGDLKDPDEKNDVENKDPDQASPETIKSLEQIIAEKEAELKTKLEGSKFTNGILKGLSKWEKYGTEEGTKGFVRRLTKTTINLALIGAISSLSVQKLAENGVGTAAALGGGVAASLSKKIMMGLGLGVITSITPEKARKYISMAVGIGGIGFAAAVTGPAAGIAAVASFGVGYASQHFIKGRFTDEKIQEREDAAKEKYLEKIKIENQAIDEDSLKRIEAEYEKIFNKYKRERIYGKLLDGAAKLTVGSLVSGFTLEASGYASEHVHTNTANTHKNQQEHTVVKHDSNAIKHETEAKIAETKPIEKAEISDNPHVKSTNETAPENIKHEEAAKIEETKHVVENKNTEGPLNKSGENVNPLHLKSIDDIKHEAELKIQADADAKAAQDTNPAHHPKTPDDFKNDAKHEAELKTQQTNEVANKIEYKTANVDFSSKGAIQTILDLKEQVRHEYPDISKAPASIQEFMKTSATEEAIHLGLYNPNDPTGNESAFVLKGSILGFDSHGNLNLHDIKTGNDHVLIEMKGSENIEGKYDGKMFDSDHSSAKDLGTHEATNTTHIGPDGKPILGSLGTIIDTPHIVGETYNEDPATYLNHHDGITPTNHVTNPDDTHSNVSDQNNNIVKQETGQHFVKPENHNNTENNTNDNHQTHDLSNKEIRQIHRIHNHNINKLFPNNYDEQNWHHVKNMDADKLFNHKPNEIADTYKLLHQYIHKLSNITGLKPLPGDRFNAPETNEQFINAALKEAAKQGRMDQVKM